MFGSVQLCSPFGLPSYITGTHFAPILLQAPRSGCGFLEQKELKEPLCGILSSVAWSQDSARTVSGIRAFKLRHLHVDVSLMYE